jgi:predicted metalloprotease
LALSSRAASEKSDRKQSAVKKKKPKNDDGVGFRKLCRLVDRQARITVKADQTRIKDIKSTLHKIRFFSFSQALIDLYGELACACSHNLVGR